MSAPCHGEGEQGDGAPALWTPPQPSLWTSIHTIGLLQKLSVCAGPLEHGPPGNKLGLAEEEETN